MDIATMLRISGSALGAQKRRLEVIAENLAGAEVTRTADGTPYRRQDVAFRSFSDQLAKAQGQDAPRLVAATTQADPRPFRNVYQPGHPDADAGGYVQMPNVNVMEEMANMISATRSYEANAKVVDATKQMTKQAMQIGQ
ncbi:MAG: flagellar basal body rod protein FlgC [Nitrospirae bacterium]|nr:flagellar basal body rod protein FlgC [Nitrospirota bacterium]